jgi:SAM-dependent methyltransferase
VDDRLALHLELAALTDEEFVERAYALTLRRPPDGPGRGRALASLGDGTLSRATLLGELVESAEFARVRSLDDAVAFAGWARANLERPRELRALAGDERPIEICWTLARLRGEGRILDIGTANAEPAYVAGLLGIGCPGLVALDLAEAEIPGVRTVVGDLRALPFADGSFDAALCISTLEHIGRDNSVYGLDGAADAAGMEKALRELRRVLAGHGRLFLTVPTGRHEEHDWFVQLTVDEWLALFRRCDYLVFESEVYEHGPDGWAQAPEDGVGGRAYDDPGPGAAAILCVELRPRTLGEALREKARALRRRINGE